MLSEGSNSRLDLPQLRISPEQGAAGGEAVRQWGDEWVRQSEARGTLRNEKWD